MTRSVGFGKSVAQGWGIGKKVGNLVALVAVMLVLRLAALLRMIL